MRYMNWFSMQVSSSLAWSKHNGKQHFFHLLIRIPVHYTSSVSAMQMRLLVSLLCADVIVFAIRMGYNEERKPLFYYRGKCRRKK